MNKIKNLFFPQNGKEKIAIRLIIVLSYTAAVIGLIAITSYWVKDIKIQNTLSPQDVQTQLGWSLLDSSITPYTVQVVTESKIYNLNNDLIGADDGYAYEASLISYEIPDLARKIYKKTGDEKKAENIRKVGDILDKNIEEYRNARWKNFNPYTKIDDWLVSIIFIVLPVFIFLRAIFYRIMLYIIFGKKIKK